MDDERRNQRYFFFFLFFFLLLLLLLLLPTDRGGREKKRSVAQGWRDTGRGETRIGQGRNNLKAELNFSSSESFVRALGGGQWLNGDVSRKVDSRERPALYRPFLVPPCLYPAGTHSPKHRRFHSRPLPSCFSVPRCRSAPLHATLCPSLGQPLILRPCYIQIYPLVIFEYVEYAEGVAARMHVYVRRWYNWSARCIIS